MKYSYSEAMAEVGAHLEFKLDINEPVEVRDLGDAFNAIAENYSDFVRREFGAKDADANFYVQEVRKGSIIVEFVGISVGLMDQALILRQFFKLTKSQVKSYITGITPPNRSLSKIPEAGQRYADMVRAVTNSEDGKLTLAYRERSADGDEAALIVTKGDAKELTTNVFTERQNLALPEPEEQDETAPRRELMRLYQHNLDPEAGQKKRTNHKAIINKYDNKPKALTYENNAIAEELKEITSENPYGEIIFDVTVVICRETGKIKAYRLIEIHTWFDDDTPQQTKMF